MKKESDMLPIVISLVPTAVWFFIIYMVAVPDVNIIKYVVTIAIWIGSGFLFYACVNKMCKDPGIIQISGFVFNIMVLVGLYYFNR